jgi:transcriptional regulator with XRE-family HTH domain
MDISTLGDFIRFKRTMGGMSQDELSKKAQTLLPGVRGLHRSAVAHWEQDTRIPNHAQARAVGDALELNDTERGQLTELIIEAELQS